MTLCTGKLRLQEGIYDFQCKTASYHSCTHRQDVCIVMQTGCLSAEAVGTECRTDTFDLVCRHGNTDTGSTDQDSFFTLAIRYCMAYQFSIYGIIYRFLAVTAEILAGNALFLQMSDDLLFQLISGVIASNR